MKLGLLGLITIPLVLGCGSSGEPPPKAPTRVAKAWCSAVPALTTDRGTDLTGEANTFRRVQRIKERYEESIMKRCPGVTGVGIAKVKPSEAVNDPEVPPERAKSVSEAEKDHLISVHLLSPRHRPERPLFLEGVPVRVMVTGGFRAL
jgi:hypothetical protein